MKQINKLQELKNFEINYTKVKNDNTEKQCSIIVSDFLNNFDIQYARVINSLEYKDEYQDLISTKLGKKLNSIVSNLNEVVLNFGNYSGSSLKTIYDNDKDYYKWIISSLIDYNLNESANEFMDVISRL